MKKEIMSNWNFMRIIRLVLGVAIMAQSIAASNWAIAVLGLLIAAMPIFNIGCCGTAGCNIPNKKAPEATKEISYEEVKFRG